MYFDIPLPKQDKFDFKPMVEVRERIERRIDRDFSKSVSDNRTDFLTRVRIGTTGTYGKEWSFAIQYQYAHDWIDKSSGKTTDEASDLSLGYVQHKAASGSFILGRQKITVGSERLIGTLEWVNVPRSMDGIRFQGKGWDAFAFKLGVGQPKPTDARVFGLAHTGKWGLTTYVFKHDQVNGNDVNISTLSHLLNKKFGDWTVDVEAAVQAGRDQGRDQRAWAWHSSAMHLIGSKTKGFIEFNAASGGSNSNSVFTFDNLYPTNHKFYGSMDLQAWKNMNEFAIGAIHQCSTTTDVSALWHTFSLRDPSDAWYGAGGAPNKGVNGDFTDPTGKSGTNVGSELDFEATFRPRKDLTLQGGVGLFMPGSFVRSLNGGSADRQTWFYVQGTIRF